jgi:hypothetical protein
METNNRAAAGARGVEKIPICRRKIARRLVETRQPTIQRYHMRMDLAHGGRSFRKTGSCPAGPAVNTHRRNRTIHALAAVTPSRLSRLTFNRRFRR